jgi:hypothetical protein
MNFIQNLHYHTQRHKSETSQSLSGSTEKCAICDYMIHSQNKFLSGSNDYEYTVPVKILRQPRLLSTYQIPKTELQHFSNKGPPEV